jgi:hypothetical protein
MQFGYSTLKQYTSRASRYALLVLIISLFALGGLLVGASTSPPDKFTLEDATTTESNGKRLKPKPGFELVAKDKTVVARRHSSSTESVDRRTCDCSPKPTGSFQCFSAMEEGDAVCGLRDSSSCCRWVKVK